MLFSSLYLDFLHIWTRCLSLMFRAMLTIWVMVLQNKHDVFLISSKAIKFNSSTTLYYTEVELKVFILQNGSMIVKEDIRHLN